MWNLIDRYIFNALVINKLTPGLDITFKARGKRNQHARRASL